VAPGDGAGWTAATQQINPIKDACSPSPPPCPIGGRASAAPVRETRRPTSVRARRRQPDDAYSTLSSSVCLWLLSAYFSSFSYSLCLTCSATESRVPGMFLVYVR
jgi:hypothetical protein